MYKVIKHFTDLQDNNHPYSVGDIFPRSMVEVTEARLKELASCNNRQGVPLIELVEEKAEEEPKKPAAKKGRKPAADK